MGANRNLRNDNWKTFKSRWGMLDSYTGAILVSAGARTSLNGGGGLKRKRSKWREIRNQGRRLTRGEVNGGRKSHGEENYVQRVASLP